MWSKFNEACILHLTGNKAVSSVTSHFSRFLSSTLRQSAQSSDGEANVPAAENFAGQPESSGVDHYLRLDYEDDSPTSVINEDIHSVWAGILFVPCGVIPSVPVVQEKSLTDASTDPIASEAPSRPKLLLRCVSAGNFYDRNAIKGRKGASKKLEKLTHLSEVQQFATPEILVSMSENQKVEIVGDLRLSKHLSHSSECFEPDCGSQLSQESIGRASSETNLNASCNSHNFFQTSVSAHVLSALKLASPTNITGNSLVMLAKGVQSLGANLDPRKKLDTSPKKVVDKSKTEARMQTFGSTKVLHL